MLLAMLLPIPCGYGLRKKRGEPYYLPFSKYLRKYSQVARNSVSLRWIHFIRGDL